MWNKEMIRSVTIFFSPLMAHNVIKSDCHYLQIHLAGPQGPFNEKCILITRCKYLYKLDILQLWCIYLLYLCTLPPVCSSHPRFLKPLCCSFVCQCVCNFSVCLSVYLPPHISWIFLCLGLWAGFWQGLLRLSRPRASKGKERDRLCHIMRGPPLLALIESSDPKLMRRGARAHLLSTANVLHRQTGERQWQCWIRFVGFDNPLHSLTHLVISHSMFAIVLKRYMSIVAQLQIWVACLFKMGCVEVWLTFLRLVGFDESENFSPSSLHIKNAQPFSFSIDI